MYEVNGKQYVIKLNDFAEMQGVSVRTIQKKLTASRYQEQLEGEFIRTASDGTWLSEEAVEFLKSTFRTQSVGFVSDTVYEKQIAELKQEKFEIQQKFTDYVAQVTPLLQKASEQLALAEASEQNRQRADALEAQIADLSLKMDEKDKHLQEVQKTAQTVQDELTAAKEQLSVERKLSDSLKLELETEKNKKMSFRDWWKNRR